MNRHNYMELLKGQIRCKRAIPMIEEEVEGHIDEQKLDFMAEGMSEKEAEEAAVREMGDPVEVGMQLDRIHRPKMEYRLLGFVIGLSVLGLCLQIFVVKLAEIYNTSDSVACQLRNDYFFRHTLLWMGLGIMIMLAICFLDYTFLGKHVLWIWGAVILGMSGYRMVFGVLVNGAYLRGNLFSGLLVPVYAGVVYHYRGKGNQGVWKSIAIFVISACAVTLLLGSSVYWMLFCFIGEILLVTTAVKGWFGTDKKRQLVKILGITVGIPIVLIILIKVSGGTVLADYQKERLTAYLSASETDGYRNHIDTMLTEAAKGGEAGIMQDEVAADSDMWLTDVRNNFMCLFIVRMMDNWKAAAIFGVMILFLAWLFVLVHKQKNYLGYVVELACALMILFESVIYIACNFGYFPVFSVSMPFLSYGGINMMITYIYMGLFLSVSRNQNIVRVR